MDERDYKAMNKDTDKPLNIGGVRGSISNEMLTVEQLEILMWNYCKEIGSDSIVGLHVCDNFRDWMVKELMKIYYH